MVMLLQHRHQTDRACLIEIRAVMPQLSLFRLTGSGYREGLEQQHEIICWINVQINALCNSVSSQCYNVIKRILAVNASLQIVVVNEPSVCPHSAVLASC